ncbi:MAG TPA: hypothetical protein VNH84_02910 [Candidatus Saccharimonadales bacterium]|nr:hypothetical protein [Candidatus Saccharimonadales bacterium]
MELARRRVKAPADGRPIRLYPLGDVHLGAAACDIEDFRRTVKAIAADPNALWLGMGDYGDLIMPSDPRWSFSGHDWKRLGFANGRPSVSNLGSEHRDMIARELDPIASKCIGLLFGNHEDAFAKYYFIDVARFLADRFKVPMLGYTALVRLEIEIGRGPKAHHETWPVTIFAEHGATGGGTDGNALNSLQKRAMEFNASVYLKGHVHRFGISQRTELAWGPKALATRDRVFVLTGTYLKGYSEFETTYGERRGYPPNELGGAVVILDPRSRRIHGVSVGAVGAMAA